MNSVEIMGGLGNQLFQYTFYRYLQKLGVKDVTVSKLFYSMEFPSGNGFTKREFWLDKYNTRYVSVEGENTCRYYCTEADYSDEIPKLYDDVLYEGYWQDIRYYNEVKAELRSELELKPQYIDESMKTFVDDMAGCNSVALHIRRSDYLTQTNKEIFEQLTLDYYAQAVSVIAELTEDEPVLYIFSDDKDFISNNMSGFLGYRTVIMELREPYQDMYLMSSAKHNILANSTFSWWAATLNKSSGNITVAPSAWMKGRNVNLYHKGWVVL